MDLDEFLYEYYLMNDEDAPFKEGENPYPHSVEDDLLLVEIAKKRGLVFKPGTYLDKISKTQHLMPKNNNV